MTLPIKELTRDEARLEIDRAISLINDCDFRSAERVVCAALCEVVPDEELAELRRLHSWIIAVCTVIVPFEGVKG